ncbi:MAG: hypothetical protein FWB88_05295 [Defluviitaleaceae bacterium]|nr:hypothetical protein [Defluviitaleaceae bacterium]MCL2239795.1 hypothetical protein [Defluviitaleaceae bacterium]
MNEQQKEKVAEVLKHLGYQCEDKKSLILTIVSKAIMLIISIIFFVLRAKAKAKGKTGQKYVFTALAVMFLVNTITASVNLDALTSDENQADEEDFEKDFE